MHSLAAILVPLIVIIGVAIIIWSCVERFSPDPLITKIVKVVLFIIVLVVLITKLFPLLNF